MLYIRWVKMQRIQAIKSVGLLMVILLGWFHQSVPHVHHEHSAHTHITDHHHSHEGHHHHDHSSENEGDSPLDFFFHQHSHHSHEQVVQQATEVQPSKTSVKLVKALTAAFYNRGDRVVEFEKEELYASFLVKTHSPFLSGTALRGPPVRLFS